MQSKVRVRAKNKEVCWKLLQFVAKAHEKHEKCVAAPTFDNFRALSKRFLVFVRVCVCVNERLTNRQRVLASVSAGKFPDFAGARAINGWCYTLYYFFVS